MECNDAARQSLQPQPQKASPVSVSSGAWFYVRSRMRNGSDEYDAFVAHTYSSVRSLVARAKGTDIAVYLGSPQADGEMVLRRIVGVQNVRCTNMRIFLLVDGHEVLWDENEGVEASGFYVDIDAPVSIGQLSDIASCEANIDGPVD